MIDVLLGNVRNAKREIRKHGFPTDFASYNTFADRMGVQSNNEIQAGSDEKAYANYLSAIPVLGPIDDVPEIEPLLDMLHELESSGDASAPQMHKIVYYLV